jgi:cytochrome b561
MAQDPAHDLPTYTRAARKFHWGVAFLILLQIPIGLYMTYRGYEMMGVNDKGEAVKGVWSGIADNGLTDSLYNSHKLIGITILLLVLWRLAYRVTRGAPPSDPSVPAALTGVSHLVHWSIYLLLIAVPIGGYIGTSYYGALDVFGIPLLAVTEKDEKYSEVIFGYHEIGAKILATLVVLHIGAALYHKFVRKDRVVERMLPKKTNVA